MKRSQEEKAKFHADVDAACAAYSARLEEMREGQRERESAIEGPWLVARRRREWQRATTAIRNVGIFVTFFWCGTVARFEEVPPQVAWPPPNLTRMRYHHEEERTALHEAHLAVVNELRAKYKLEDETETATRDSHRCVERRLLQDVIGEHSNDMDMDE
jgi:hypothetical protein